MAYKQIKQLHKNIELIAMNVEKEGTCNSDEVKIKAPALDFLRGYAAAVRDSFEEDNTEEVTYCKDCFFAGREGECRLHPALHPDGNFYCRDGRPEEEEK